jgi:hypothetical protein
MKRVVMDRRFKVVTEQISARLAPTSIPAAPLQLWELHGLFSQFLRIEGTTFFSRKRAYFSAVTAPYCTKSGLPFKSPGALLLILAGR